MKKLVAAALIFFLAFYYLSRRDSSGPPESIYPNFPWSDTGEMMAELHQVGAWITDIREEEGIFTE